MTLRALALTIALALLLPAAARFGWKAGDDAHAAIKRASWVLEDSIREWRARPAPPMMKEPLT